MMTHPYILVATDFSKTSDLALRAAEKLRQRSRGRIHVIHVTPHPVQLDWFTNDVVTGSFPSNYKEEIVKSLQLKLNEQINNCGVTGDGEILMGPPGRTILHYSAETKADLIILGHKGKKRHFHLGDIAAKVVSGADRPVLVINKNFEIDKVAGLVDPFEPEKSVFVETEEMGFLCSGKIEFISLWPDQDIIAEEGFPEAGYSVVRMTDEKKEELRTRMEKTIRSKVDPHFAAKVRTEFTDEPKVRDGLVKLLDEEEVDLAVMTKHHKGKLEKILLGSVTRGVLDRWHGNLMVLPS